MALRYKNVGQSANLFLMTLCPEWGGHHPGVCERRSPDVTTVIVLSPEVNPWIEILKKLVLNLDRRG